MEEVPRIRRTRADGTPGAAVDTDTMPEITLEMRVGLGGQGRVHSVSMRPEYGCRLLLKWVRRVTDIDKREQQLVFGTGAQSKIITRANCDMQSIGSVVRTYGPAFVALRVPIACAFCNIGDKVPMPKDCLGPGVDANGDPQEPIMVPWRFRNADGDDITYLKSCCQCKAVFYCSRQCQTDHWVHGQPTPHRSVCKPVVPLVSDSEGEISIPSWRELYS